MQFCEGLISVTNPVVFRVTHTSVKLRISIVYPEKIGSIDQMKCYHDNGMKNVYPKKKLKNAKRSSQVRSRKTSSIDKTIQDFRKEFTGNIKERNQRRLEVLHKFENSYDYWKEFDLFLEEMIDMEETFIN